MKYILGLLVGLEILDGVLSYLLIENALGREANPFLQSIVLGNGFLLFKVCGGILIGFLLWTIYTHWPRVALGCTSFFAVLYAAIVTWNLSLFFL